MRKAEQNRVDAVPGLPIETGNRNVRWAIACAVAVHAALFLVELPEIRASVAEPEKPEIIVLTPTPWQPKPPEPQELIPRRSALRVPVPDPTPDDPEPIRQAPVLPVEPALPDDVGLVGIPEAPPEPDPTGPYRVGGEVKPPVRLYSPPPRYPELARKARVQGRVIVEAIIDETGRVTEARIIAGQPMGLDQAALDAISRWRFEPATLRGRPVPVLYNLTIKFELH